MHTTHSIAHQVCPLLNIVYYHRLLDEPSSSPRGMLVLNHIRVSTRLPLLGKANEYGNLLSEVENRELEMKKLAFLEALSWTQDVGGSKYVGGVGKNIVVSSPSYNSDFLYFN